MPLDYAHEEAIAAFGQDPRRFDVQVQSLTAENECLTGLTTTDGDTIPCGLLIAATGFAGCASAVCDAFGVSYDRIVRTVEGRFTTNVEKVFAAGDMRRGQSLGGVGHRRGPLRGGGGGRVSERVHEPCANCIIFVEIFV